MAGRCRRRPIGLAKQAPDELTAGQSAIGREPVESRPVELGETHVHLSARHPACIAVCESPDRNILRGDCPRRGSRPRATGAPPPRAGSDPRDRARVRELEVEPRLARIALAAHRHRVFFRPSLSTIIYLSVQRSPKASGTWSSCCGSAGSRPTSSTATAARRSSRGGWMRSRRPLRPSSRSRHGCCAAT
jgi:hypothetical protein